MLYLLQMKDIKKHSGLFQYADKEIEFSYWSNTDGNSPPDTVIFLGAGAVGVIPRLVATNAGSGVVVVQGIPHWHAHPSAENIADFSRTYFIAAFRTVLDAFKLECVNILAESQAAPAPVLLTIASPKHVRNIALIRPLGFTVSTYGATPELRMLVFRKRILQTYLQFPQSFLHDPRNLSVFLTAVRAFLQEPTFDSLTRKYAAGISYDLLEECKQALEVHRNKGSSFTVILGENDKMFPPYEILAALDTYGIEGLDIVTIPGDTHSSLAVRASKRALQTALDKVRASAVTN